MDTNGQGTVMDAPAKKPKAPPTPLKQAQTERDRLMAAWRTAVAQADAAKAKAAQAKRALDEGTRLVVQRMDEEAAEVASGARSQARGGAGGQGAV